MFTRGGQRPAFHLTRLRGCLIVLFEKFLYLLVVSSDIIANAPLLKRTRYLGLCTKATESSMGVMDFTAVPFIFPESPTHPVSGSSPVFFQTSWFFFCIEIHHARYSALLRSGMWASAMLEADTVRHFCVLRVYGRKDGFLHF